MTDQTTTTSPGSVNREVFEPIAGILAVIIPGAGHVYLKQTWRGVGVAVGVLGLFFGGILIGGIDVVDRKEDKIWFIGQAMVGPIAFATDYYHQTKLKAHGIVHIDSKRVTGNLRTGNPGENRVERKAGTRTIPVWEPAANGRPPNTKSLAHFNEIGTLFATIAGMLNLIAILDALFHRETREEIDLNKPATTLVDQKTDDKADDKPNATADGTADDAAKPVVEGA